MLLLTALALSGDATLRRMLGWVERVQRAGLTAETVTLGWLLRLALAFGATQLPAESLRLRQLHLGALATCARCSGPLRRDHACVPSRSPLFSHALARWGGMLGSYDSDFEQQQIALGPLSRRSLLESLPAPSPTLHLHLHLHPDPGALSALLESDGAVRAFHEQAGWYSGSLMTP